MRKQRIKYWFANGRTFNRSRLVLPIITILLFVSFCAFSWPPLCAADPFSFDDIQFWVGSGANRAALAIDWVEDSTQPPALAWGYRWDGAATGRDMLLAVVAADDRLFAKLDDVPDGNPVRVFGLGYDADRDGEFGIDDGTGFDESGFADGSAPFFPAAATDADDYYAEGWTFAFWHYGVASTNPYDGGSWTDIQFGMASRVLTDGAWDSWAFENTTLPPFDAYAQNPIAAMPPGGLPGDFNNDGHVDSNDYDLWRSEFGSTSQPAIDASGNGVVDAADYVVWRKHQNASNAVFGATVASAPEPSTILLACFSILTCTLYSVRNRKERF
ncbi:MAG: hypothetical protein L0228_04835 [Planctomycetes bacterium]|nr:hypothetical protein [Planctomycetota bacterium]